MKLYATTVSERAMKGQGGNEYLKIIIRNEGQQCIGYVTVKPDNSIGISILDSIVSHIERVAWIGTDDDSETKGKKKKSNDSRINDRGQFTDIQ
jgi:hypothetical protein